jgi:hypothetical protein
VTCCCRNGPFQPVPERRGKCKGRDWTVAPRGAHTHMAIHAAGSTAACLSAERPIAPHNTRHNITPGQQTGESSSPPTNATAALIGSWMRAVSLSRPAPYPQAPVRAQRVLSLSRTGAAPGPARSRSRMGVSVRYQRCTWLHLAAPPRERSAGWRPGGNAVSGSVAVSRPRRGHGDRVSCEREAQASIVPARGLQS